MTFSAKFVEPRALDEGVADAAGRSGKDPYRTLDDLMAAVEVLCPVWPPRDTYPGGTRMLL